jgi:hypothetical protein
MATLTTVDGVEIHFNPDGLAVIAPDPNGAVVYGVTHGAVRISEGPAVFMARLAATAKFARLTRPDGSLVWISGAAVSSLRAPLAGEYPQNAHAVVFTGALTQAVQEAVATVLAALNAHGGKL